LDSNICRLISSDFPSANLWWEMVRV
jgi:hypothetical protein